MRGTGVIDLARLTLAGELIADLHMDMSSGGESDTTTMTTALQIKPQPATSDQGAQKLP